MKRNQIIIIVVVLVILVLLLSFRNELSAAVKSALPKSDPAQPNPSTQPVQLDYNKVLKKGITAPEVGRLQQLLGVDDDDIFGQVTENALAFKKGVLQTTLNEFINVLPDVSGLGASGLDITNYFYQSKGYGTGPMDKPTLEQQRNYEEVDLTSWTETHPGRSMIDLGNYGIKWA